jgi:cytochrome bd ubiquinol oxidase subunit I
MFSMAMWMALLVAPVQIFAGDQHGLNTLKYQPAKIAAMEGHYRAHEGAAPLILFGIPYDQAQRITDTVEIPHLGSLILTHSWSGRVPTLAEFPPEDRPPAEIIFWTFRVMVGIGLLMVAVGLWSGLARLRGKLYEWRRLHRAALLMGPAGFGAVLAGWITTEVGRQPFVVYGHLRTIDAASPIEAPAVEASLIAFVLIYFTIFGAGTFYILRLMGRSPDEGGDVEHIGPTRSAGITPAPSVRRKAHAGE